MPNTPFSGMLATPSHRMVPVSEFRALKGNEEGQFVARVMTYNIVDDYRTVFKPKVFAESMASRMPRIVWGHDWTDPLGRWVEADDTRKHLDLLGEFDDFTAVPKARQAYAQLQSGTIDQFSVGFMPEDGKVIEEDEREIFAFTRARLDEVSLVLTGAVPGTKLLSVRSYHFLSRGPALITKDKAAEVLVKLQQGEMDLADALVAIKQTPEVKADDDGFEDESDIEDAKPKQEPEPEPEPEPDSSPGEQGPGEQGPGEGGPGEQGPGQQDEVEEPEPESEPTLGQMAQAAFDEAAAEQEAEIQALFGDVDAILAKYA